MPMGRGIVKRGVRFAWLALVTASIPFWLCCAGAHQAGDEATPSADDSGTLDAGRRRDAKASDAGDVGTSEPSGDVVPEGWIPYEDYHPGCGFYIPPSAEYLPAPIQWDSCATMDRGRGLPGPDSMVCQRMRFDWDARNGEHTTGVTPAFVHDGKVTMFLRRLTATGVYDLVADVDGPVHQALLQVGACRVWGVDTNAGKVLYRIRDDKSVKIDPGGGAIGGAVESLRPTVYRPYGDKPSDSFTPEYSVGPQLFVESFGGADRIYSFTTGELVDTVVHAPEDYGTLYTNYLFHGDDMFWIADSSERTAIKVWTRDAGIRTFVGWPGDFSRGAESFGTDETDMVWIEGSDGDGTGVRGYTKYEMWTAKYSADPSVVEVAKRRVGPASLESYAEPYFVGCGYAAIAVYPMLSWGRSRGVQVTRLSDGMSWSVLGESDQQLIDFSIYRPFAVTCDEIFLEASSVSHSEIVRIRLDSLGPGTTLE